MLVEIITETKNNSEAKFYRGPVKGAYYIRQLKHLSHCFVFR